MSTAERDADGSAALDHLMLTRVVIPLDVPWVIQRSALNQTVPVRLGALPANLCLPGVRDLDDGRTAGVEPDGFFPASGVDSGWVSHTKLSGEEMQCALHALAFEIPVRTTLPVAPADMIGYSLKSDPAFTEPIHDWIDRFGRWARLLLGQMLDPSHPSPSTLNPPHHSQFIWGVVDGHTPLVNSSPGPIGVNVATTTSPLTEWAIDEENLGILVDLANQVDVRSPMALEMFASARQAGQRKLWRLAIAELGTAAEALLRARLSVGDSEVLTLGALLARAEASKVALPADVRRCLLRPRNAAVHRGLDPDPSLVLCAFEIVERLLWDQFPQFARSQVQLMSGARSGSI